MWLREEGGVQAMKGTNARIYRRHRPKCKFFGIQDSLTELSCNCRFTVTVCGRQARSPAIAQYPNQVVAWKKLGG
jgi:hypothetical protein